MAKMYFTFKWGKSIYVTNDDLKKILLKYYTKEEVDNLLKQYTKTEDLLDILTRYAELDYVEREVERLDTKIDSVEDTLNSDIDELGNHVNDNARDLRTLEERVSKDEELIGDNKENISKNKIILDEVVTSLKNAKLWNIIGYYDNSVTYNIGNVVGYTDDNLYLCLVDNTVGIPPTNTSNWLKVSGVQSVNLDDYYNKTQINELLNTKVNTSELTQYAKLDRNNTFSQNKRNVYHSLPEVYTEKTLPTKNTHFTTKKYVDDTINTNVNTCAKLESSNTFSQEQHFHGGFDVNTGSQWNVRTDANNFIIKSNTTDFKKVMVANSRGEQRNLLDVNDYWSLDSQKVKSKYFNWSQCTFIRSTEHAGLYPNLYRISGTGLSGNTVIGCRINPKNYEWSSGIVATPTQNGDTVYITFIWSRNGQDNINGIWLYYI